ncbi:2Fe-2S iron-sulfur cluster binding domain-containing protein [Aliikangiella marina]|uniref:2Fe-2S iron-sulfur cluster binding domain-containing protein n=1 Tax=Aliikangiella marina TaxID=1712262 RepID=A0A545T9P7_9GAMM|nr:PepSY domain-containing protein [Aliikangiella marina]TQV73941.1 2Fe-2S iron-sulfur cluster binding domain-containing protein [Aliikangiella marina]
MINNKRVFFFRKAHKWLALIVGIQAVIWCLSGLYMTAVHIETVRGNHLVKDLPLKPLENLLSSDLNLKVNEKYYRFHSLAMVNDEPELTLFSDSQKIKYNLRSGELARPISEQDIADKAAKIYVGNGNLQNIQLLNHYPQEIGGKNRRVWRVTYDDFLNSTLYFDFETAELIRARSDLWRWFDFLWMLHIMDYDAREDVNNNLLKIAATMGLLLTLCGIGMLFYSFGHRKVKQVTTLSLLKSVHKWLALVIGLQLVIWTLSGVVFSLLDKEKVSGRYLINQQDVVRPLLELDKLKQIQVRYPAIETVLTHSLLGNPVYQVNINNERIMLDSKSLEPLSLSESTVKLIATQRFRGDGELLQLSQINVQSTETRKYQLPLWKADFNDAESTSLYIDAKTGNVMGAKTDTWRLFDFFWMLHIMDYGERNDFNHALIIFAAAISCFIALSGLLMLFSAFKWSDFSLWTRYRTKRINLNSREGELVTIQANKFMRLLDLFNQKNIAVRSSCGGGGSCGLCRIKVIGNCDVSPADRQFFTETELQQGYRLACQVELCESISLELPARYFEQLK